MRWYRGYSTEKPCNIIEYHYCNLDPEKRGCEPGLRKECSHLKGMNFTAVEVNCPHLRWRQEEKEEKEEEEEKK